MYTLIEAGSDIEEKDANDCTPLYIAALNGRVAVVRLLLDLGADKEAQTDCCVTPLFAASMKGHEAVVQMLLDPTALGEFPRAEVWVDEGGVKVMSV